MKKISVFLCLVIICSICSGCDSAGDAQVAATTLPVYEFTARLCEGTGISVTRLVTEEVSCLHDYTLKTSQMRAIEGADLLVINGGGLEDFLEDALTGSKDIIDASTDMELHCGHQHGHDADSHGHDHQNDPHIWLSPVYARSMVHNIAHGLCVHYPQFEDVFTVNAEVLISELEALEQYGKEQLAELSCRKLITFHDGFTYMAECFDLRILRAVEEESGAEASAQELIELIRLTEQQLLPAIFTERSGSTAAAEIISSETGVKIYALDMAMSGTSYFDAMYHNINTLKEALE